MMISRYEVKISNVNIVSTFHHETQIVGLVLVDNLRTTRDHTVSPVRAEFSFCWVEMLNTAQRQLSSSGGLSTQFENKIDDRKYTETETDSLLSIVSSSIAQTKGRSKTSRNAIFAPPPLSPALSPVTHVSECYIKFDEYNCVVLRKI